MYWRFGVVAALFSLLCRFSFMAVIEENIWRRRQYTLMTWHKTVQKKTQCTACILRQLVDFILLSIMAKSCTCSHICRQLLSVIILNYCGLQYTIHCQRRHFDGTRYFDERQGNLKHNLIAKLFVITTFHLFHKLYYNYWNTLLLSLFLCLIQQLLLVWIWLILHFIKGWDIGF